MKPFVLYVRSPPIHSNVAPVPLTPKLPKVVSFNEPSFDVKSIGINVFTNLGDKLSVNVFVSAVPF